MKTELFDQIYDTMLGHLLPEYQLPWVEDAFAPGSFCDREYEVMRVHYARICLRLHAGAEDAELDAMLACMEKIQRELCRQMFDAGRHFQDLMEP